MLGISAAKAIQPYFEDEHNEPDTLPTQFIDPETKYCQPYPHWKASLTKQVAWIPTYILRFRSTIPNNRSELSTLLKSLSDEQIVVLLNDGPFKTAQTVWRDMKKTDEELEIMRANARKYQRTDRVRHVYLYRLKLLMPLRVSRRPQYVVDTSRQYHRCKAQSGNTSFILVICHRTRAMMKMGL